MVAMFHSGRAVSVVRITPSRAIHCEVSTSYLQRPPPSKRPSQVNAAYRWASDCFVLWKPGGTPAVTGGAPSTDRRIQQSCWYPVSSVSLLMDRTARFDLLRHLKSG